MIKPYLFLFQELHWHFTQKNDCCAWNRLGQPPATKKESTRNRVDLSLFAARFGLEDLMPEGPEVPPAQRNEAKKKMDGDRVRNLDIPKQSMWNPYKMVYMFLMISE